MIAFPYPVIFCYQVKSGEVCAIMGPSGAGKSSLLNVLAGRSSAASGITIEGKVEVGGQVINPVAFRKNIAYVMQDDALMATATPREALTFSATMRLPSTVSLQKIDQLVNKLLDELGLTDCADVMIGGALIKGISGGQRKRTSVDIELITNPSVSSGQLLIVNVVLHVILILFLFLLQQLLFLDEPTSGLDSFSAFSLVTLLKKVAKGGDCTMLCTIHQPSSEVFFLFDKVIFMKAGRVFYHGPVMNAIAHFQTFGYDCPANYNPSDYIMNLSQTLTLQEIESKDMYMEAPLELQDTKSQSLKFDQEVVFKAEASFTKQMYALTKREVVNSYRDVAALVGRFGVTIILHLLYGLIFLNAGDGDNGDPTEFNSHLGAVTMVVISSMFGCAQPVMLSFPYERPMFLREYSTGTCKLVSPFLIIFLLV
jgi:ABC-type multidrug transport system ATPase subunit